MASAEGRLFLTYSGGASQLRLEYDPSNYLDLEALAGGNARLTATLLEIAGQLNVTAAVGFATTVNCVGAVTMQDTCTISGAAAVVGTATIGGGSNDKVAITPNAAGFGVTLLATNAAGSAYEPLHLQGDTVTFKSGATTIIEATASGAAITGTLTLDEGDITFGAADSGGSGYRVLRVPNA